MYLSYSYNSRIHSNLKLKKLYGRINVSLQQPETVHQYFPTKAILRRCYPVAFLPDRVFIMNRKNCVAYSISRVAETRDRALSFSREVDFVINRRAAQTTINVLISNSE